MTNTNTPSGLILRLIGRNYRDLDVLDAAVVELGIKDGTLIIWRGQVAFKGAA